MNFLEKLDLLMDENALNRSKLSQISGVPYTTIDGFYKKGYDNTKISTIRKIAKALNVSLDYLMVDEIADREPSSPMTKIAPPISDEAMKIAKDFDTLDRYGRKQVRDVTDNELARMKDAYKKKAVEPPATVEKIVYVNPAAAGVPLYAESDFERMEFPADAIPKGADFGVRISGDSMEPTIPDGAIVWVNKTSEIQEKQIGIFMVGDSAVCKRFHHDCHRILLLSDNPKYQPIQVDCFNRLGIVGVVLGYK